MSDRSSTMRPSRAKVWVPLTAGEPAGRPFAEWAYRTPRFPNGIKGSDLSHATPDVQRETMAVWFIANHVPAEGPYFGFAEAASQGSGGTFNSSPFSTAPLNSGIQVAGFDQGRFFNGGSAADILKAEFKGVMQDTALSDTTALFQGLWELLPLVPIRDLKVLTPDERIASLVATLDELPDLLRKLTSEHGSIGHNGPPDCDPSITTDEKEFVLRATEKTRLAVLSSDYPAAILAWETIAPIVQKIGSGITKQVENLFTKFTGTLGITGALLVTGYIGYELGFWNKTTAIAAMLELAKHLPH